LECFEGGIGRIDGETSRASITCFWDLVERKAGNTGAIEGLDVSGIYAER
jgi:hypothetical protein